MPVEYATTCLAVAADLVLTIMAYYFIKALPGSSGGIIFLVGMLLFTLATAIVRIVMYAFSQMVEDSQIGAQPDSIDATVIFLTDIEAITSVIASCAPGVRAWYRGSGMKRKKESAAIAAGALRDANGASTKGSSEDSSIDIEGQTLEFLQELKRPQSE